MGGNTCGDLCSNNLYNPVLKYRMTIKLEK